MKFCVQYESGLKNPETPLFFILTTAVAVVLYSIKIIAIHVVWHHILGTGKGKSFHFKVWRLCRPVKIGDSFFCFSDIGLSRRMEGALSSWKINCLFTKTLTIIGHKELSNSSNYLVEFRFPPTGTRTPIPS